MFSLDTFNFINKNLHKTDQFENVIKARKF